MKNVCIVGYGSIGPIHARAIQAVKSAKLYAVCDIEADRRSECKRIYDVIEYEAYDDMLKDPKVDSVHICTPHYLHYEMIKKALKMGKDVVVEKPVTRTKEEFVALQQLHEAGKIAVVMQNRLNPCVQRLKDIVRIGTFGKVEAVKAILTWHRDKDYYAESAWKGKWKTEGGGLLINQAIHTLDLFNYIIGDVKEVKANLYNYSMTDDIEVEDTLNAYLEFEDGAKGIFFATNAYYLNSDVLFEVVFENGFARYMDKQLWVNGVLAEEDSKTTEGKDYWGKGHEEFIRRYYDEQQFFSVFDVANTMHTMFSMYKNSDIYRVSKV